MYAFLKPNRWSLRLQLFVALSTITVSLLVILGVAAEPREQNRLSENAFKDDIRLLLILGSTLSDAMIAKDSALISELLHQLGENDPALLNIEIRDARGGALSAWQRPTRIDTVPGNQMRHKVKRDGQVLGEIRMSRDLGPLFREVEERVFELRVTLIATTLVIAIIVGIIIFRLKATVNNAFSQRHTPQLRTDLRGKIEYANQPAQKILTTIGMTVGDSLSTLAPELFGQNRSQFTELSIAQKTFTISSVHLTEFNSVFLYLSDNTENTVLRRMPEQNPNPVLRIQSSGEVIYANPASDELLEAWGISLGSSLPDIVANPMKNNEEQRRLTVTVQERVYELDIVPVAALNYFNVYANDMTHMVALEAARERLLQKEKLASLGGLVAGVAHELNTPIGVTFTAANLLADEVQELMEGFNEGKLSRSSFAKGLEQIDEIANLVKFNSERAAELIKSFKGVAVDRANAGVREIELQDYVNQIVMSLGPYLKREKVSVKVMGDVINATIAAGAFSQVITNLVQNTAVHAYEGQGGEVEIEIKDMGAKMAQIKVIDHGVGIPSERLSRVFDPLYTTKFGQGGSGLGLHICCQMVEETLHGQLEIESQLGKGTTFTMELPTVFLEKATDQVEEPSNKKQA